MIAGFPFAFHTSFRARRAGNDRGLATVALSLTAVALVYVVLTRFVF